MRCRPRSVTEQPHENYPLAVRADGPFSFINVSLADLHLEHRREYRLLFTTSQRRDATSTDIADYNEFVQSVADSSPGLARVGLEWTVIGSTADVDAMENTMTTFTDEDPGLPIYRVDGPLVARSYERFWGDGPDGGPNVNLAVNEFGDPITDRDFDPISAEEIVRVFTGLGGLATSLGAIRGVEQGDALAAGPNVPGVFVGHSSGSPALGRFYALSSPLTAAQIPEPDSDGTALVAAIGLFAWARRQRASRRASCHITAPPDGATP